MSRSDLATEIVRELEAVGMLPPTRGDAMERLARWIEQLAQPARSALCDAWREGRQRDMTLTEIAAMIADAVAAAHHGVPAALLAVYVARFVGESLCADDPCEDD